MHLVRLQISGLAAILALSPDVGWAANLASGKNVPLLPKSVLTPASPPIYKGAPYKAPQQDLVLETSAPDSSVAAQPAAPLPKRAENISKPGSKTLSHATKTAASTIARLHPPKIDREDGRSSLEAIRDFASLLFSNSKPPIPLTIPKDAIDMTKVLEYHRQAIQEGRAGPMPKQAWAYSYRFVRGISWDAVESDYFATNIARMRALGLDAEIIETDPLGTSQANANKIKAAILPLEKPVVLLGHSKGAVDSIEALTNSSQLREKVPCLVVMQAPYSGSAVADWFISHPWLYTTTVTLARFLNPWRLLRTNPLFRHRTARELSNECRGSLCGAPPLLDGVKIFSVVSSLSEKTLMGPLIRLAWRTVKALTGQDNDGLIVPEQGIVPGWPFAIIPHASHMDMVATAPSGWNWKPRLLGVRNHDPNFAADLTEAIVRCIQDKRTFRRSHRKTSHKF